MCAGTDGEVTREDLLAAGAMVDAAHESDGDVGLAVERKTAAEVGEIETGKRVVRCQLAALGPNLLSAALGQPNCDDTPGGRNLLSIEHGSRFGGVRRIDAR